MPDQLSIYENEAHAYRQGGLILVTYGAELVFDYSFQGATSMMMLLLGILIGANLGFLFAGVMAAAKTDVSESGEIAEAGNLEHTYTVSHPVP